MEKQNIHEHWFIFGGQPGLDFDMPFFRMNKPFCDPLFMMWMPSLVGSSESMEVSPLTMVPNTRV